MVQVKAQPASRAQTPPENFHEQQSAGQRPPDADLANAGLAVARQREQLLRQISEEVCSAASVEEAVERAITALGREMGTSEVVVRLGTEAELLSHAASVSVAHAPSS